jgi:hypothetical protein
MPLKPPPLPSETLSRILNVATFDGRLLMMVGGVLAILHAAHHQSHGAIVGCLIAGAGALELHGAGMLRVGVSRGMDWLVRSQLLLLVTLLLYAATQLLRPPEEILEEIRLTPDILALLDQWNITQVRFAQIFQIFVYTAVGVVTIVYQGLMALYYHRRRSAVDTALDDELLEALNSRD